VEGHLARALEQLRWALATGVSPVLICSALAQGVRLLGRVGSAPRNLNTAALAAEVGAPPWKIDRVRQQVRGWPPDGVARALHAVAEADAQVKGETSNADYALERAVRRIVAARAGAADALRRRSFSTGTPASRATLTTTLLRMAQPPAVVQMSWAVMCVVSRVTAHVPRQTRGCCAWRNREAVVVGGQLTVRK
jgi:hypothetical protein